MRRQNKNMNRTIRVDGKLYQKSIQFGNRKLQNVSRNRKQYTRKSKHPRSLE